MQNSSICFLSRTVSKLLNTHFKENIDHLFSHLANDGKGGKVELVIALSVTANLTTDRVGYR